MYAYIYIYIWRFSNNNTYNTWGGGVEGVSPFSKRKQTITKNDPQLVCSELSPPSNGSLGLNLLGIVGDDWRVTGSESVEHRWDNWRGTGAASVGCMGDTWRETGTESVGCRGDDWRGTGTESVGYIKGWRSLGRQRRRGADVT